MVHHHRIYFHHQPRKGVAEPDLLPQHHHHQEQPPHKVEHMADIPLPLLLRRRSLLRLLFLFSLVICTVFLAHRLLPQYYSDDVDPIPPCSSLPNNSLCCDRTAFRSDLCFLRGDVRTHSPSSSLLLFNTTAPSQLIRPYTRKWESSVMATIDELHLRPTNTSSSSSSCDVRHDVPAIVFSTGGYTGNVYHEFNDGLLPLYITSRKYNRRVVFLLLEYHDWWVTKYSDVLSRLSDFPPIDFTGDNRTHCFPAATVGLRIHDELTVDPSLMPQGSILDFRRLLDDAYRPRIHQLQQEEETKIESLLEPGEKIESLHPKLKLVIVSRNGSRAMENEKEIAAAAEEAGFRVEVLRPERTTEMARVYRAMNSCDVMVGVHGAAMTHFLFMRPGSVFIQVVPLGTDWAAEAYYGTPAARMGLKYVRYKVAPRESSLYREYRRDDPVLRDPDSVNAQGWEMTKRVYLDGQKVRLDVGRFRKRLVRAHQYLVWKNRGRDWKQESRR